VIGKNHFEGSEPEERIEVEKDKTERDLENEASEAASGVDPGDGTDVGGLETKKDDGAEAADAPEQVWGSKDRI
jgi:hypothetical protein